MVTDPSSKLPFGELLRRLRVTAGLTQEALAERAGLSARGLSDLERGVRAGPRQDTLDLLVAALALGPAERTALVAAARRGAAAATRPRAVSPITDSAIGVRFSGATLPIPVEQLIGREREVAALSALLGDPSGRLVTLTGPGGVGKTRLALEVASTMRGAFPGGVVFVPLAAIRDASLVLPTVAQALGVRETVDRPPEEALAVVLRGRRALLVLDNLEQVLDAGPALGRLLAATPELRLLLTSRVPLRLTGEQRYPVPPLATPHLAPAQPDALADNPAMRLFAQCARQVRPNFALTSDTADAVAMICRRLDGLPLAIQLAAARVAVLAPAALLLRLERTLPLLTGGPRDQPARLQTMREAIAWSYDLLSAEEQALFRQLAVFAGGFSLEAAAAVWQSEGASEVTVFEGIAELVEASLVHVQAEDGPGGEPRFSLLETIREYGAEQLAANGEEEQTRERHAAWVSAFAEEAEPQVFRAEQQTWWSRLETELPNIRASLDWFEQTGDAERALRLAGALTPFSWMRGYLREGQEWLRRALAIPGEASAASHAWALCSIGALTWFRGDNEAARTLAERALALARAGDFALGVAVSYHLLAITAMMQGDLEQALVLGVEGIAREREVADPHWLAILLSDIGTIAMLHGDDDQGKAWSSEGLALNRALGNRWAIGIHLSDLGVVAQGRGDLAEAARQYAESARLFREVGDTWYIASPLAGLAAIAVSQGGPETAARLLGVATALREASGSTVWTTERERDEQTVALARAALGEERYAQALEAGRALPLTLAVDEAIAKVGEASQLRLVDTTS
jgi:predicted ATPase/transcriptional regulator with XRE-family HTH domain